MFPPYWFEKRAESEDITEADVPLFKFEILDYNKISEMLENAIREVNESLKEANVPLLLIEDISGGEDVFEVFMSKKKNGRPKDDYPSCDMQREVKKTNVIKNRFTVVFSE